MVTATSKAILPSINEDGGKSRIQDSDFEIQICEWIAVLEDRNLPGPVRI